MQGTSANHLAKVVSNQWTGLLDWTMDYWTDDLTTERPQKLIP